MAWWVWLLIGVYVIGFVLTIMVNPWWDSPITPGLSLLRAFVWPVWWVTGWPHGVQLRMD